jgi:hypothetical protein
MDNGYTISFSVDQSLEEVFDAINNVRGGWSDHIDGSTDKAGAEFAVNVRKGPLLQQGDAERIRRRRI